MPRLPWSCQCNAERFYFQRTNPSSFHANHLKRLRVCCNVRWSIWKASIFSLAECTRVRTQHVITLILNVKGTKCSIEIKLSLPNWAIITMCLREIKLSLPSWAIITMCLRERYNHLCQAEPLLQCPWERSNHLCQAERLSQDLHTAMMILGVNIME